MTKDAKHLLVTAQVEKGKIQSAVSDSRFMCIVSDRSTDSSIVEQETVYVR